MILVISVMTVIVMAAAQSGHQSWCSEPQPPAAPCPVGGPGGSCLCSRADGVQRLAVLPSSAAALGPRLPFLCLLRLLVYKTGEAETTSEGRCSESMGERSIALRTAVGCGGRVKGNRHLRTCIALTTASRHGGSVTRPVSQVRRWSSERR